MRNSEIPNPMLLAKNKKIITNVFEKFTIFFGFRTFCIFLCLCLYVNKNFIRMQGGGGLLEDLADMSLENLSFFGRLPLWKLTRNIVCTMYVLRMSRTSLTSNFVEYWKFGKYRNQFEVIIIIMIMLFFHRILGAHQAQITKGGHRLSQYSRYPFNVMVSTSTWQFVRDQIKCIQCFTFIEI